MIRNLPDGPVELRFAMHRIVTKNRGHRTVPVGDPECCAVAARKRYHARHATEAW